jgi:hypothetical protein
MLYYYNPYQEKQRQNKKCITYMRWVIYVTYPNNREIYTYGKFKYRETAEEYACDMLAHTYGAKYTIKQKMFCFYK